MRNGDRFRSAEEPIDRRTVAPTPSDTSFAYTELTTDRDDPAGEVVVIVLI